MASSIQSLRNRQEILVKTRFLLPTLSKSERKAANLILKKPSAVVDLKLNEFAEMGQCSESSVIRFCQRLGLSGFSDLRVKLSSELSVDEPEPYYEVSPDDDLSTIMEKVFQGTIQTLRDTLAIISDCDKALDALIRAEFIAFFGTGDAHVPCQFADMRFRRLGIPTRADADPDMQLMTASLLGENAVAFAISHSGRTRVVVEAMRLAKKRGATTICITKSERSPLTEVCDIKLYTATVDPTVHKEIIARRVAELAILETLYFGVLVKKGPQVIENRAVAVAAVESNKY